MNQTPVLRHRYFDANGNPLAGGKLYSYAAGTTTPQATYSDSTGTANANPVVLDSSGYADVWLDPTLVYKFVLKDSLDATLWTIDNVSFLNLSVNVRTVTANTTLTATDGHVRSNSTAGNLTHTLPPCSTTPTGKTITIKDVGTGGYATTVKGSGTDLIDGINTYGTTLSINDSISVTNNGTSWDVT
jgi:hypothetical protein